LPYLELQSLYESYGGPKFDRQNPWRDASSLPPEVRIRLKNVFACPSDGGIDVRPDSPMINYVGVYTGFNDGENYDTRTPRAFFRPNTSTRVRDITDGLSNTFAMGEALRPMSDKYQTHQGLVVTARAGSQFFYLTNGPNSAVPDVLCRNAGLCAESMPHLNRPCFTQGLHNNDAHAAFRSQHPGGVNMLIADGSVQFIFDSVSLETWRARGTIAGGEANGDY
jgi:prepilin-type processing-associated H-X9-DG protein